MRILLGGLTLLMTAWAQDAASPQFEAASVKPAPPPTAGRFMIGMRGGPGSQDPGRITYNNVALKEILAQAYAVKGFQITGPPWLDSERFDITATMAPGTTRAQFELMLQNLLADRFKLALHHEKKDLPAYVLTVSKKGVKMKQSEEDPPVKEGEGPSADAPPPPPPPMGGRGSMKMGKDGFPEMPAGRRGGPSFMIMPGKAKLTAEKMTMQALCDQLSRMMNRPVVDHTELEGKFDFTLYFAPDMSQMFGGGGRGVMMAMRDGGPGGGGHDDKIATEEAESGPTLFAAVQEQLGLKLDAQKTAVDVLVIDRLEKVPTEN